jgi:hypothetical protein
MATMQFPGILSYQGPELDVAGNFLRSKQATEQGALQREELEMKREDRAREQSARERMQGVLSQMSGEDVDYEQAALSILPDNPQMANSLLAMERHRQQEALDAQTMEINSMKMAQARIEQQKAKIETETKAAMGAVRALEGVEEPEQKERIYSLYLKSVKDQGIEVPEELMGGWTPENEENLRGIARIGQAMLDLDPSARTAEMKNFDYSQQNPEFQSFMNQQNARDLSGTEAIVQELREEDPSLTYAEALSIAQGLARKAQTIKDGRVVPLEGALETEEDFGAAGEKGKKTGAAEGEAVAEYEDFIAALPGLEEVSGELLTLAEGATYTDPGKFKDWASRQAGLDVSDAAEARAGLVATIDVEVLPLLRPTFGAQFTVTEGEWLKATLMNPDASPAEKKAQLRARVKGWKRHAERLARRTGKEAPKEMFENVEDELGLSSSSDNVREFSSIEEAEAANLPPNTKITINGRQAVVE